ncbi:hypothetical protein D1007_05313 [Hordeum vulgare]|nr:hypothetical protein D1007_05313 [Hordeum vulgare]
MVLIEKEAKGFVFSGPVEEVPAARRWTLIGKACTPRPVNFTALERSLRKAWGLHHDAQFRDLGNNLFLVHFGGEGDWKHSRNNGPWQFDFNVLILKGYDGKTRTSEMVFDSVEAWVRVEDLPLDRRTREFGEALGNWLGEVVKVDVERDGFVKGKYLRVRAKIFVYEPVAGNSRTGEGCRQEKAEVNNPARGKQRDGDACASDLRHGLDKKRENDLRQELINKQADKIGQADRTSEHRVKEHTRYLFNS